jgi:hypothetical protein
MAIGMHAQDWWFNENAYSTHCVVYAHLVDASGNDVTERGYTLGAFIDGVCRGQQYTELSSASAGTYSWYFPIRIGGTSADNGKNITFKLWSFDGTEYAVSGTPVITYQNEATLYQPSDCYGLLFKAATELSLPSEITVDVGETIDLLPLITVTPAGANMPTNLTWDYVNGGSYIDVTDNKLKGKAKPGDDRIYLGLDAGQLSTYTMVKVFQPITSLTLKSQYVSGVTVNLNDVATLTNILDDCYVATPDDADEQPLWTSTNTSAIYQSLSGGWVPAMTGTYAMTLNSKNKSLTLNVTIKKGVTDVYNKTKYYRAEVGDDLSNLAAHGCGVTPEDATDKTLNVTVETPAGQASAAAVQINAEGKLMAVAPGTANVVFTSRDNPQISGLVVVEVYPKVTGIKVNQDPLSITYSSVNTDVSNAIKGNFSFLPSGVSVERQYYTIASSNQSVIESGGDWGDISMMTGKGQTTMSVTYTIWKTVYDAQTDTFVDEDKVVTKSFVVNVVEGLSGFSLSPVKMALGGTKTVKLTPQPAGAAYDASLITLSVGHGIGSGWILAEAAKSGTDGLTWTLEAKSVGAGTITINYGTASYGSAAIEIGQQISYAPGWKWVSFYAATQPRDTIFIDTLSLNVHERYIYYRVHAVDFSGNRSDASATLAVLRPNFEPTITCRIDTAWQEGEKIYMRWNASMRKDVAIHRVFRRIQGSHDWVLVGLVPIEAVENAVFEVVDSVPYLQGLRYIYAVETLNTIGVSSGLSMEFGVMHEGPRMLDVAIHLQAKDDEKGHKTVLVWDAGARPVDVPFWYVVYRRAAGEEHFHARMSVPDKEAMYEDYLLESGKEAEFYVTIQFEDGRVSTPSNIVKVVRPQAPVE